MFHLDMSKHFYLACKLSGPVGIIKQTFLAPSKQQFFVLYARSSAVKICEKRNYIANAWSIKI